MSAAPNLRGIIGALLIGAISPGPSFVLVSRTSLISSRRHGLAAALGMGIGSAILAILALLGLMTLLLKVQWLYLTLRVIGGLYLVHLGIRIWRGAAMPLDGSNDASPRTSTVGRSFAIGLATQLSNPKTAIVYASTFAVLLPCPPRPGSISRFRPPC